MILGKFHNIFELLFPINKIRVIIVSGSQGCFENKCVHEVNKCEMLRPVPARVKYKYGPFLKIEVYLIYNIISVSGVQHSDSIFL